jgi:FAD:protein FMN transferase
MPSADRTARSRAEWHFDAIGTAWQIDTTDPLDRELTSTITDRIEAFDRTWSRFRPDSLVSRIAREPGSFAFPTDAVPLFDLYRRLYEATAGSMTPLIGRSLEVLGYDAGYSLRPTGSPIAAPTWNDAFAFADGRLTTTRPVVIDIGAAGKGYLVDIVCGVLDDAGVDEYIVDASGDLRHRGRDTIRVALEHPGDATKAVGVATIGNRAICASAPNRRAWGAGLHHVLDALTGLPTSAVLATWVVADEAMVADGLATALFFSEAEQLLRSFSFSWVRILADGRVEHSTDLGEELFP